MPCTLKTKYVDFNWEVTIIVDANDPCWKNKRTAFVKSWNEDNSSNVHVAVLDDLRFEKCVMTEILKKK